MELTTKQEQVLSLASRGLKDRAIAETLGVSIRTVQNHLARIYTKTQTANRTGAVMLYLTSKVNVVKRGKYKGKTDKFKG